MHCLCALALLVFGQTSPGLAQTEKLALISAKANGTTVERYGLFELTVDLKATFDNPFDPEEVDLFAEFVPPGAEPVRVNGFYTRAFTRKLEGGERIEAAGDPFWQIRFAPDREGTWRYRVVAKDRTGTVSMAEAAFTVTPSSNPGFLRRNTKSPHLFAFDNGQPFVAIGENMCWGAKRGSFDYDDWLAALGREGGNWVRLWMTRWNCCLEWSAQDSQSWDIEPFGGLGVYSLGNAWKLDTILDSAAKNGVYVMVTFGTYGEYSVGGYFNEGMWTKNPYNAVNGGPCAKPADLWSDEKARKLYRQRLRYIAARYGWRTQVFGWEFWNEALAPASWVSEMAQFLKGTGAFAGKSADPFRHLLSTSYGTAEVWNLPEIDFTQTHHYGEGNLPDEAPVTHNDARAHFRYGKPHLMAEFGIDWRSSDDKYDGGFKGINLHNGLWSSLLSGNAGGAMIWYWDSYVDPGKLYPQFGALRRFSDQVPWHEGPWKPLEIDPPQQKVATEIWQDLVLAPADQWGKCPIASFTVTPTRGTGGDPLPSFLYGPDKADLRTPLVVCAEFEQPGRFDARVNTVSGAVKFAITVDDGAPREFALSSNPPADSTVKPEYESTEFRKEYNVYQARFNKKYGIDVPAGKHTIRMEVTEGDWLSVMDYTLSGYVSNRFARVNVYGLTNGRCALLWAQNAEHGWLAVKSGKPVKPVAAASATLHGLAPGTYECEWWDTWKGAPAARTEGMANGEGMVFFLPELGTDLAAILRRP